MKIWVLVLRSNPDAGHEAAAKVLQKIDNMMEKGIPLNEVLSVMGLSHEKFNKIKILLVLYLYYKLTGRNSYSSSCIVYVIFTLLSIYLFVLIDS